ncbi:Binding-protein-dependent transport systems inner membrane component [Parafrankia sp. Ea1.12]|nr:Binding-protein-dependent transport systems inner membrane component [Parafrankia sp. Ea1.12]
MSTPPAGPRALAGRVPSPFRRLAGAFAVILGVSVVTFAATSALPGDNVRARLGPYATEQRLHAEHVRLGLDHPVWERYLRWISGLAHGDLGRSQVNDLPVATLLSRPMVNSLTLAAAALAAVLVTGTLAGVTAGLRPGGAVDRLLLLFSLTVSAVPAFVTGSLLVLLFAVDLRWLPALALVDPTRPAILQPRLLVLPAAALTLSSFAYVTRLVRASVLDAAAMPWALAARLRGIPRRRVVARHILPAALPVLCQAGALTMIAMVTNVVVVEIVFGYPGVGNTLQTAVSQRDVPVIQAVTIVVAAFVVTVSALADGAVRLLLPRARTAT